MFGIMNSGRRRALVLALMVLAVPNATIRAANEPSIDELKARLSSAGTGDRPRLCLQIAERQLDAVGKLFATGESDKALPLLTDVVAFSEQARDYAIQSRKYQKQSEIAVRKMARKLIDLKHAVPHDDQPAVQDAVDRLQRVRDDLLFAMFPHGKKGDK
jgi:hypothetical protein